MASKKEFRRRYWMRLLARPVTVGSVGAAAVAGTVGVFMSHPLIAFAVAGGALAVGAGTAFYNVWFRAEDVANEINQNMQREVKKQGDRKIKALGDRLKADGDTRDDRMFDDVCALYARFTGEQSWMKQMNPGAVSDMQDAAKDLFNKVMYLLGESVTLLENSEGLSIGIARPLLEAREQLLQQVDELVSGLGELYALVQRRSVDRMANRALVGSSDVKGVMDKFHAILEIDQRVEERMGRTSSDDESQYDQYLES